MKSRVLVVFATRSGSTEELARNVAEALAESGLETETRPIRKVDSLQSYGAVVVAAALYMGRLHSDARKFLAAHHDALKARPVALFVPGPVHATSL